MAPQLQVGEKHAQLKVVVYEGLRHYRHERHEEEVQDSKAKRGRGKKRKLDASSTAGWICVGTCGGDHLWDPCVGCWQSSLSDMTLLSPLAYCADDLCVCKLLCVLWCCWSSKPCFSSTPWPLPGNTRAATHQLAHVLLLAAVHPGHQQLGAAAEGG